MLAPKIQQFSKLADYHYKPTPLVMLNTEASRNKIRLFLENKKQNMFSSENNLESTRVLLIHKGP